MGIDDPAAAEIDVFGIIAGSIDPDNVRQILNRPRFQKRDPMSLARQRPIGDHHEQICPLPHRHAKNLRKAKVITDERTDREIAPAEGLHLASGRIAACFAAAGEGMNFLIAHDLASLGIKNGGLVLAAFGVAVHKSRHHPDAELLGQIAKEFARHTVLFIADLRDLHRKSRIEHLRQHEQRSLFRPRLLQQLSHVCVIGRLVLPGDIELHAIDFHAAPTIFLIPVTNRPIPSFTVSFESAA